MSVIETISRPDNVAMEGEVNDTKSVDSNEKNTCGTPVQVTETNADSVPLTVNDCGKDVELKDADHITSASSLLTDAVDTQHVSKKDTDTHSNDGLSSIVNAQKAEAKGSTDTSEKKNDVEKPTDGVLSTLTNDQMSHEGEPSSSAVQSEHSVDVCQGVNEDDNDKAVQMNYRGVDSNSAKSDTSCQTSEDESSSELSEFERPIHHSPNVDDEDDDADDEDDNRQNHAGGKSKPSWPQSLPRTKGELCLDDLPPIEELTITVGDDVKMVEVGMITSMVHTLVVVQAKSDLPPLNEDTVLFLEGKKVLGQVFETFGPVSAPLYSVRFNSPDQIKERQLHPGLVVFYAPDAPEYTHYVFMAHLQSIKASDASWEHNNEPPPQCLDYSDDEEERRAKGQLKQEKRNRMPHEDDSESTNKGKKSKRKSKGGNNYHEKMSSPKLTSGSDMRSPKGYQSWPPNTRMAQSSQNGRMAPVYSNSSSGSQNYRFRGARPNMTRFMQTPSQATYGRGHQPVGSQTPQALGDSLLNTPAAGVSAQQPHAGFMQPGHPGEGMAAPPASFTTRHPPPGMAPHSSFFPGQQYPVPPPDSGQSLWHQPHSQHFSHPSHLFNDNAQLSELPPLQRMGPPPAVPSYMRPRGRAMGFPYASNQSPGLGFNNRPENVVQQQFGGEPQFVRGPLNSSGSTTWASHPYQQ